MTDPQSSLTLLADDTRRAVLARLRGNPGLTASELSAPLEISKPALSRHLKSLEDAGLISRSIEHKFHRFALTPFALSQPWMATMTSPDSQQQSHLKQLEAESIHIFREVAAEMENPVMMYSIGKDSSVLLHLALKAFYPSVPPFTLLHIDTTWKFKEMISFRNTIADRYGLNLKVHTNQEGVAQGLNPFEHGSYYTDTMKTAALKQALNEGGYDVAFGGARRDEEKSRAKERVLSFRGKGHVWDPKNQRPELWDLYNTRIQNGETIRAFPISNWTELDIWQYIYTENVAIPSLYLAKERPVVERNGTLIMVDDERMKLEPGEEVMMKSVRFRTLGCYPLTGAVESEADTLEKVIQEMQLATTSEREGRLIDKDQAASMEKKKLEGYF